jgi:hypothetical protein
MLANNNPNNRQSSQNGFLKAVSGLSMTAALVITVIFGGNAATAAQGVIAPLIWQAYENKDVARLAINSAWLLTFPVIFFSSSATLYGTVVVTALKIAKWLF